MFQRHGGISLRVQGKSCGFWCGCLVVAPAPFCVSPAGETQIWPGDLRVVAVVSGFWLFLICLKLWNQGPSLRAKSAATEEKKMLLLYLNEFFHILKHVSSFHSLDDTNAVHSGSCRLPSAEIRPTANPTKAMSCFWSSQLLKSMTS